MKTQRPHISNLRGLSLSALHEEALGARPDSICPEMISVSMYSAGARCKGNCRFCGWSRDVTPQPQERRELAEDILRERIAYAREVNGALECMDNTIAATPKMFEQCERVAQICGPIRWGVSPGICRSRKRLARFREMGAAFYANNIETRRGCFAP